MRELAERMNLSKQQMTKIIAKLVKINFAERNYDKDDRRIIKISATKEADEYIKLESKAFARRLKDIVNSLNEEDLRDLENAIKSMNKILPKFPK
ncbi:MarR family winged helix-turn-helix transcriptional regulator [Clostridium sp.]|uniref:MarR family winged helix-turn-helix transcriptional regulator n=1 Tax=Clostridium sp. TaxID=1506 RepID=UPI002FDEBFC1